MKEGAWINSSTRAFAWIDEHARWIRQPANARSLGLDEETIARLQTQLTDFNGTGRVAALQVAMDAGLIRFRGHGAFCALEGTLPCRSMLMAAAGFLKAIAGPHMVVGIRSLRDQEAIEAPWWVLEHILEQGSPEELTGLVKPCALSPVGTQVFHEGEPRPQA